VEFYTQPGVFSYKRVDEGTRLLIESVKLPRDDAVVLDLGCGYGVIGITLAKAHSKLKVYMVDVNPVAVELARLNARHNGVSDRVEVLLGDLYEPVRGLKFDLIVSNPPLAAGLQVLERIVSEAPYHLNSGGSLQLVVRKGAETVERMLEDHFTRVEVLARKKGYTVLAGWKM
jgi:16S rRNA G1207 methylase RsmC